MHSDAMFVQWHCKSSHIFAVVGISQCSQDVNCRQETFEVLMFIYRFSKKYWTGSSVKLLTEFLLDGKLKYDCWCVHYLSKFNNAVIFVNRKCNVIISFMKYTLCLARRTQLEYCFRWKLQVDCNVIKGFYSLSGHQSSVWYNPLARVFSHSACTYIWECYSSQSRCFRFSDLEFNRWTVL